MILNQNETNFQTNYKEYISNENLKKNTSDNINLHLKKVKDLENLYFDLEKTKKNASFVKNKAIIDLPLFLTEFESNLINQGGKVIWAQDYKEVSSEIVKIAQKHSQKKVILNSSDIVDELNLKENLKSNGIDSLPADFAEYMNEKINEPFSHPIFPYIQKSKSEIQEFIKQNFELHKNSENRYFLYDIKSKLAEQYKNTTISINSANFLIADTGAVCISENEGYSIYSSSEAKVSIVIAGIDQIIPKLKDLYLLLPLYSTYAHANKINIFNSITFGPRNQKEIDGPEEFYVILVDNGRTQVLEQKNQRRALACINCASCINNSEVYKQVGGKAFGTTYKGPIGAVITPYMKGLKEWNHLSFIETACEYYTINCPLKINLHELILFNRNTLFVSGTHSRTEKKLHLRYKNLMLNRKKIDRLNLKRKNKVVHNIFKEYNIDINNSPTFSDMTFKQLYKNNDE